MVLSLLVKALRYTRIKGSEWAPGRCQGCSWLEWRPQLINSPAGNGIERRAAVGRLRGRKPFHLGIRDARNDSFQQPGHLTPLRVPAESG